MYSDRAFKRKRFLSLIISGGYSFVSGVEYVVILPTAWSYLQSLGVTQEFLLGFMISAYSFAGAFAGVIGGRLADMYMNHTKLLLLISIALRVFGNFQYLIGINVWNVLVARLICGIGSAAGTAILAEICRTTTLEERNPILSINNAMFELGILVGPGFQLFLSSFDFSLFGVVDVNVLNAPGLFMGVFWLLYFVATTFMFYNLADEFRKLESLKRRIVIDQRTGLLNSMNSERYMAANMDAILARQGDLGESVIVTASLQQYKDEFLTDTFVLILSMLFILIFCVTGMETVIPVITQEHFGFDVFQNSLIYMVGGIEAVVLYFVVGMASKYIRDSTFQLVGWIFLLFSQVWLMIVIPTLEHGSVTNVTLFMIGIVILYLGNPVAYIANTCLLSKVLSNETQGLGQGLMRLFLYLGLIFGPTWAGSTVRNSFLFLGVSTAILIMNGIMLAVSFKSMRRAEDALENKTLRSNSITEESSPLLKSNEES